MSRKARSDSKIEGLPLNQRETLERWLFEENVSYDEARSRLFNDFNVRVSQSALHAWRGRCAQGRLLERIAASAQTANAVVQRFEENPADTYKALLGMVGKIAFDKALADELDAETIYNFTRLLIADKKEDTRLEALGLMKEKLELEFQKYKDSVAAQKKVIESELAKVTKGGGLSAAALRKIEEAAAIL